jgi:hypothetical protein
MSNIYGSQPPPISSPLGGRADAGRNRLVQALMQIQQPPGGMASPGVPGLPPELGQQDMTGDQGAMPAAPGMGGQAGMAPPNLVGMQPGQLPMGMQPQAVLGGAPPLPMPPRQGM